MWGYSWRLNNVGLGAPTPSAVENLCKTLQSAFYIHSSTSLDSTNLRSCSTTACIY